jgi:hypothetical protein
MIHGVDWFLAILGCALAVGEGAGTAEGAEASSPPPLNVRLGFRAEDRVLIINGDDAGMSHAANLASIDSLENGLMTSATIMVPCPWFLEMVQYARAHPRADLGVHLTHTSEWKLYRWGPIVGRSEVPGLVDPQGYLWPSVEEVYAHGTPEEAYLEGRAQIRRALDAGIDVTHLDSHMGALQYDLRYFQVYVRLAREFDLPLRMASQAMLEANGAATVRAQVAAQGIVFPDDLIHGGRRSGETVGDYWKRMLSGLKPGVTELYIHAAVITDEMKVITGTWQDRNAEYQLFTKDPTIKALLDSMGVKRVGYRALRELQRGPRGAGG